MSENRMLHLSQKHNVMRYAPAENYIVKSIIVSTALHNSDWWSDRHIARSWDGGASGGVRDGDMKNRNKILIG
jgi:hypothetical protein